MLSCKLGLLVRVRCSFTCFVWVCAFASSLVGCARRSESGQESDVSVEDQSPTTIEGRVLGGDAIDGSEATKALIAGATSAADAAGGVNVSRNDDSEDDSDAPMFYTVAAYDVNRDPVDDLRMTVRKANQEQKRILLQVGGDWCNWCGRLADFIRERERVRTLLEQHFLIMKVASQSKFADDFLADYPKINAYPFVYVLSAAGELLHSQDMGELELG